MPTTSVRRLTLTLRRSTGLVKCARRAQRSEGHKGQHISLSALLRQTRKFGQLRAELVGDLAPLRLECFRIATGKRGGDEGGDNTPPALAARRQCIEHECTRHRCQVASGILLMAAVVPP